MSNKITRSGEESRVELPAVYLPAMPPVGIERILNALRRVFRRR